MNKDDRKFVDAVRRQAERQQAARQVGFWQGLTVVGAVGWMVVLPAVGGAFLGRWLDEHYNSGVFWTLGLLTAGLAMGCASAWRHVKGEMRK